MASSATGYSNMPNYKVGDATWRKLPRVRTKPTGYLRSGRQDSGGGYERVRSYEYRPHTPGDSKEDVYAYVHRLCAVAWLLPDDEPLDLSLLDGVDVHHAAPEVEGERGVPWDNRESVLHLRDHGRHSEITQAEMRSWGEDAKRTVEAEKRGELHVDACSECGAADVSLWTCAAFDGERCTACAKAANPEEPLVSAD